MINLLSNLMEVYHGPQIFPTLTVTWRYRAGGDGILLPEPRAGACRRELRVGTDHRSGRHTRPCSEHERQRPGQTMRIVLVVQHEVARTSTAPYNEGSVRTFM